VLKFTGYVVVFLSDVKFFDINLAQNFKSYNTEVHI